MTLIYLSTVYNSFPFMIFLINYIFRVFLIYIHFGCSNALPYQKKASPDSQRQIRRLLMIVIKQVNFFQDSLRLSWQSSNTWLSFSFTVKKKGNNFCEVKVAVCTRKSISLLYSKEVIFPTASPTIFRSRLVPTKNHSHL